MVINKSGVKYITLCSYFPLWNIKKDTIYFKSISFSSSSLALYKNYFQRKYLPTISVVENDSGDKLNILDYFFFCHKWLVWISRISSMLPREVGGEGGALTAWHVKWCLPYVMVANLVKIDFLNSNQLLQYLNFTLIVSFHQLNMFLLCVEWSGL